MNKQFSQLVDESIQLELNVAKLYKIFHDALPEDADFWWQLVLEEENHAALIRSGKEQFEPLGLFPRQLLSASLQDLKDANHLLRSLIKKYEETSPSREEALNVAFKIEQTAGEVHFQEFMDKEANTKIDEVFKTLNKDDKDHADRIRSYLENLGLRVQDAPLPNR